MSERHVLERKWTTLAEKPGGPAWPKKPGQYGDSSSLLVTGVRYLSPASRSFGPVFVSASFARSLFQDQDAVEASLSLVRSNGVTEGSVNRLKFSNCQMQGRASFRLLRTRFVGPC